MLSTARIFGRFFQKQSSRNYSTVKPSLAFLAQIRKKTEVSISKAKEALIVTNNDLEKALIWLEEDLLKSGAKKAVKLAGRVAGEGLVGVATLNSSSSEVSQGVLVEICCETDFVTRNAIFQHLVSNIAQASLNLSHSTLSGINSLFEIPVETLLNSRVSENGCSVKDAISETIAKLGENIILRRAVATYFINKEDSFYYTSGFSHGGVSDSGRISGLVVVEVNNIPSEPLMQFSRQLCRHIVGLNPECVQEADSVAIEKKNTLSPSEYSDFLSNSVLLNQAFLFGQGTVLEKIEELKSSGSVLKVSTFARIVAGEGIEKTQSPDFRQEVLKQVENSNKS